MSPISALFFFLLLLNPTSAKSIGSDGSGGFGNGLMDDPMLGNIAKKMFSKFSSFLSPSNSNDIQVVGNDDDYYDDVAAGNITKIVEEKIRQCTCVESKECIIESYRTLSICRQSCKMHLEYFGAQSSEIAECFPKNAGEAEAVNQCLKKDAPNFCSKDSAPKFITKPTYDKKSLSIISELDIAKLTGISIIEHWNAFHSCADSCLKKKMIECFENKKCGIQLPAEYDLGKIADFCLPIKNARKQNGLYETFSQTLTNNDEKVLIIIYNDKFPGGLINVLHGYNNTDFAHSKGILLFRGKYGTFIQHSAPKYTKFIQDGKIVYPKNAFENGMHFFCTTFDESQLDVLGRIFYFIKPRFSLEQIPEEFKKGYIKKIADKDFKIVSVLIVLNLSPKMKKGHSN